MAKRSKTSTPLKAVKRMNDFDHGIFGPEGAREITKDLGLDPATAPIYVIEHRPDTVKGARLNGCAAVGEKRYGVGAHELAEWACRRLNVAYEPKMGRGAALRECCAKLREHFSKTQEACCDE